MMAGGADEVLSVILSLVPFLFCNLVEIRLFGRYLNHIEILDFLNQPNGVGNLRQIALFSENRTIYHSWLDTEIDRSV